MPRFVLHIGPHKTGSTYLQHAFTLLRPTLATRGIFYPEQPGRASGHAHVVEALRTGGRAGLADSFASPHHSGAEIILLSSELFADLDVIAIRLLRDLVAEAPVEIVFYARRWPELLPSEWQEQVKHGAHESLPAFLLPKLHRPEADPMINYGIVLERYADVFGFESLRILSYNRLRESGKDLAADFCHRFLDWHDLPDLGLGRVNESMDMVDTELLRALNVLERERTGRLPNGLCEAYFAAKPELPIERLVSGAMRFRVAEITIDESAPALARLHADLVRRFGGALMPAAPAAGFFDAGLTKICYVTPDYLMTPGVMETLRSIHETLIHRMPEATTSWT